jgi:hypothetical protein
LQRADGKAQSVNTVQSIHKSTTGLTLHSHAITQYLYLVSTEKPAVDPFIYMTAIVRFYDITISLNVHTINMKVFSLIDRAEKIVHCKAD